MLLVNEAKSQKPKIESVNQSKEQLKSTADTKFKIHKPYLELKICLPIIARDCPPFPQVGTPDSSAMSKPVYMSDHIEISQLVCEPDLSEISKPVCGPGEVTVLFNGEDVTNPPKELITAVKSVIYEVQEIKKKIGKIN